MNSRYGEYSDLRLWGYNNIGGFSSPSTTGTLDPTIDQSLIEEQAKKYVQIAKARTEAIIKQTNDRLEANERDHKAKWHEIDSKFDDNAENLQKGIKRMRGRVGQIEEMHVRDFEQLRETIENIEQFISSSGTNNKEAKEREAKKLKEEIEKEIKGLLVFQEMAMTNLSGKISQLEARIDTISFADDSSVDVGVGGSNDEKLQALKDKITEVEDALADFESDLETVQESTSAMAGNIQNKIVTVLDDILKREKEETKLFVTNKIQENFDSNTKSFMEAQIQANKDEFDSLLTSKISELDQSLLNVENQLNTIDNQIKLQEKSFNTKISETLTANDQTFQDHVNTYKKHLLKFQQLTDKLNEKSWSLQVAHNNIGDASSKLSTLQSSVTQVQEETTSLAERVTDLKSNIDQLMTVVSLQEDKSKGSTGGSGGLISVQFSSDKRSSRMFRTKKIQLNTGMNGYVFTLNGIVKQIVAYCDRGRVKAHFENVQNISSSSSISTTTSVSEDAVYPFEPFDSQTLVTGQISDPIGIPPEPFETNIRVQKGLSQLYFIPVDDTPTTFYAELIIELEKKEEGEE